MNGIWLWVTLGGLGVLYASVPIVLWRSNVVNVRRTAESVLLKEQVEHQKTKDALAAACDVHKAELAKLRHDIDQMNRERNASDAAQERQRDRLVEAKDEAERKLRDVADGIFALAQSLEPRNYSRRTKD